MKIKLFILVLALQTAWLLGTVALQEHALATGKVILLETQPLDPRDLLRGDYLILNYKISTVPGKLFSPPVPNDLAPGTPIYVALAPGTNHFYEITRAGTNAFAPSSDEILVIAKSAGRGRNATNSIRVTYGIENYFVAENTGNPVGKLTVQVAVPASGRPTIKQVFLDGKPYAEVMRDKSP